MNTNDVSCEDVFPDDLQMIEKGYRLKSINSDTNNVTPTSYWQNPENLNDILQCNHKKEYTQVNFGIDRIKFGDMTECIPFPHLNDGSNQELIAVTSYDSGYPIAVFRDTQNGQTQTCYMTWAYMFINDKKVWFQGDYTGCFYTRFDVDGVE